MFKTKEQIMAKASPNMDGSDRLFLSNLADFEGKNEKLRTFALARLCPGQEVKFHIHESESESYYILSGTGVYNDDGNEMPATPGMVTFTPSGHGHGIKNTGDEMLEFIALILLD